MVRGCDGACDGAKVRRCDGAGSCDGDWYFERLLSIQLSLGPPDWRIEDQRNERGPAKAGHLYDHTPAQPAPSHHRTHRRTIEPSHHRTPLAPSHHRTIARTVAPSHRRTIAQCTIDRIIRSVFFRGQLIGKYRILSSLGSGGFGSVYLAEDTWIDKKVALKVPHKQHIDFTEMLKEPRLLASMSHPNIVTVLTAEKQQDVFFIVMEYVAGETLEHIIATDGALDVSRALDFTCQICNAVDHAHRAGILHRDLRPGNMLVSEKGVLKVTDFGTSRVLEIAAHGTTVIGSPPYMAPEQFQGKAVFASDVYSIGVTMYQMLTGALPYGTPAPADMERLMRGELVQPPRLKNSRIPRLVNDIVLKALHPDVTARYQRASDVLNDVLTARAPRSRRATRTRSPHPSAPPVEDVAEIQSRLRAREVPQPRFCWHCRKPLHARTHRCPFCGEAQ